MSAMLARRQAAAVHALGIRGFVRQFQDLATSIPAIDNAVRNRCIYCENPGNNFCAGCNAAQYCSVQCQRKDWSKHKFLCKEYKKSFVDNKRPSPNHVRGIFFPAYDVCPHHVWVEQKVRNGKTIVMAKEWIGRYTDFNGLVFLNSTLMSMGWSELGHGLVMMTEAAAHLPGIPINKSILSLGKPGHMAPWFGGVLVLAVRDDPECPVDRRTDIPDTCNGSTSGSSTNGSSSTATDTDLPAANTILDDVNFRDFRHALDNFEQWQFNPCIINKERYKGGRTMPALMLHCKGSYLRYMAYGLKSRMEKVTVPVNAIPFGLGGFIEQEQALHAAKLGLDWYVRRHTPTSQWCEDLVTYDTLRNDMAAYLIRTDPLYNIAHTAQWGIKDVTLKKNDESHLPNIGDVLVMDSKGGVIEPYHMEVVSKFMDSIASCQPRYSNIYIEANCQGLLWLPAFAGLDGPSDGKKALAAYFRHWKKAERARNKNLKDDDLTSPLELRSGASEDEQQHKSPDNAASRKSDAEFKQVMAAETIKACVQFGLNNSLDVRLAWVP